MKFTRKEFDTMVEELLYSDKVRFDMLCHIADKTLSRSVMKWCYSDPRICGREYEYDLMQNIQIRLIQTTVDQFLVRSDKPGPFNDDPEGFEDWMFKVARSRRDELFRKIKRRDAMMTGLDSFEKKKTLPGEGRESEEERIERLKRAFSVVMASDVSIYKVLTWLAHLIFIVDLDVTKIRSNDLILAAFEDKTLSEMYNILLVSADRIPWLVITGQQHKKITEALETEYDGDVTYGKVRYKEFFMKHNGDISGKKSISDWMYRMNCLVKKNA